MKLKRKDRGLGQLITISLAVLAGAALVWGWTGRGELLRDSADSAGASGTDSVFSPAHSSLGEALGHFFGWRPEPEQPIPFLHQLHREEAALDCTFCHSGVALGPIAVIPGVELCMECHLEVATDRPAIQALRSFYDQGREPPWQRVYGWLPEAHVRFNHAPHIRAEVECAACHGDVARMTVAERVVEHTMGFCIDCHRQNEASTDCLTCHY